MKLSDLGFDPWFENHNSPSPGDDCSIARVSAVDRGAYRVRNESQEVSAELSGRLSYRTGNAADLPCVGDWVAVQYYDEGAAAIIHRVFPRKTWLRRKRAGEIVDFQMIAANIDRAFIVQSCHFDFNPRRLERYLAMAADGKVEPVVVLTKTDLIPGDDLKEKLAIVNEVTKARVLGLSCVTGSGFDLFQETLVPGKRSVFLALPG
jgi:ribosome biogenesis GTPase / thiamine phosphate phosphatase